MKFNRMCLIIVSVLALAISAPSALAESHPLSLEQVAASRLNPPPFAWEALRTFVQKCAVQPFANGLRGRKVLGNLRSICPELTVAGPHARFVLNGQSYSAEIMDSRYSDGGDLNDLKISNAQGEVLVEIATILSYGDVILALALGNDQFTEIEDDTLLLQR